MCNADLPSSRDLPLDLAKGHGQGESGQKPPPSPPGQKPPRRSIRSSAIAANGKIVGGSTREREQDKKLNAALDDHNNGESSLSSVLLFFPSLVLTASLQRLADSEESEYESGKEDRKPAAKKKVASKKNRKSLLELYLLSFFHRSSDLSFIVRLIYPLFSAATKKGEVAKLTDAQLEAVRSLQARGQITNTGVRPELNLPSYLEPNVMKQVMSGKTELRTQRRRLDNVR